MRTGSGADIIVDGDVVIKVHRVGTDPDALAVRLRVAAHLGGPPTGPLLAPLDTEPQPVDAPAGRRWSTRWPRVDTGPAQPGGLPWAAAARLLARLHLAPDPIAIPHGAAARTQRAVSGLPAGADAVV